MLVVVTYNLSTRPKNADKSVGGRYSFVSAPLATRVIKISALNALVIIGVFADIALAGLKFIVK
jgi:hypothetical protein